MAALRPFHAQKATGFVKTSLKVALVFSAALLAAGAVPALFQLTTPAPVHATAADTAVQPAVVVAEQTRATPPDDGYGGYGPPRQHHSPRPHPTPRGLPSPAASPTPATSPSTAPATVPSTAPAAPTPTPTQGRPTLPVTGGRPGLLALAGAAAVAVGVVLVAGKRRGRHARRWKLSR